MNSFLLLTRQKLYVHRNKKLSAMLFEKGYPLTFHCLGSHRLLVLPEASQKGLQSYFWKLLSQFFGTKIFYFTEEKQLLSDLLHYAEQDYAKVLEHRSHDAASQVSHQEAPTEFGRLLQRSHQSIYSAQKLELD